MLGGPVLEIGSMHKNIAYTFSLWPDYDKEGIIQWNLSDSTQTKNVATYRQHSAAITRKAPWVVLTVKKKCASMGIILF